MSSCATMIWASASTWESSDSKRAGGVDRGSYLSRESSANRFRGQLYLLDGSGPRELRALSYRIRLQSRDPLPPDRAVHDRVTAIDQHVGARVRAAWLEAARARPNWRNTLAGHSSKYRNPRRHEPHSAGKLRALTRHGTPPKSRSLTRCGNINFDRSSFPPERIRVIYRS